MDHDARGGRTPQLHVRLRWPPLRNEDTARAARAATGSRAAAVGDADGAARPGRSADAPGHAPRAREDPSGTGLGRRRRRAPSEGRAPCRRRPAAAARGMDAADGPAEVPAPTRRPSGDRGDVQRRSGSAAARSPRLGGPHHAVGAAARRSAGRRASGAAKRHTRGGRCSTELDRWCAGREAGLGDDRLHKCGRPCEPADAARRDRADHRPSAVDRGRRSTGHADAPGGRRRGDPGPGLR